MITSAKSHSPRPTHYRSLRRRVYHMLGGEGHEGVIVKIMDYALVTLICVNCVFSVLESVEQLAVVHGHIFRAFDKFSVIIFSIEYILRIWTAVEIDNPRFRHPILGRLRFLFTPMAIVDLIAIAPFYLGIFFEVDLRAMRVLRLLRVFKLTRYSQAMTIMIAVLRQEARAIGALLFVFAVILVFVSSLMYLLEHLAQPRVFADIPAAMWWAVVTMTTLGYGDMVPVTSMGKLIGALTAVIGVGMIALPAGVLASGFSEQMRMRREVYLESAEKAVTSGGGQLPRRARRRLEDTRVRLGLSHDEAAYLLEKAVHAPSHCPHCGGKLEHHHEEDEV